MKSPLKLFEMRHPYQGEGPEFGDHGEITPEGQGTAFDKNSHSYQWRSACYCRLLVL